MHCGILLILSAYKKSRSSSLTAFRKKKLRQLCENQFFQVECDVAKAVVTIIVFNGQPSSALLPFLRESLTQILTIWEEFIL